MKISTVDTPKCLLGEGPIWDVAEEALYLVDVLRGHLLRHDPRTESTKTWTLPSKVGSFALRRTGGAIVALEDGIYSLDLQSGAVRPLTLLTPSDAAVQFNDGKVDRSGRFVVGTTERDWIAPKGLAHLYCFGPDRSLRILDSGICFSNGPCWSPDNRTLYFSDSHAGTIFAYDYDIATGSAANRRMFATTKDAFSGVPDGATVDHDGLLWVAVPPSAKIVCYRPDGIVERVIEMPVAHVTSVNFGGSALDRLYVTSLDTSILGDSHRSEGGGTYVVDGLGSCGLAETRFDG